MRLVLHKGFGFTVALLLLLPTLGVLGMMSSASLQQCMMAAGAAPCPPVCGASSGANGGANGRSMAACRCQLRAAPKLALGWPPLVPPVEQVRVQAPVTRRASLGRSVRPALLAGFLPGVDHPPSSASVAA